jgi:nucleoside-diphosphate kinase
METTLVLLKPDAVRWRLLGEIISRLERKGLLLVGMKMLRMDRGLAARHYAEHVGKSFYEELVEFITSGPLVALAVQGPNAIRAVRTLIGNTDPLQAAPGTIRGDFGLLQGENLVHASDSPESARRELALFFEPDELHS